MSDTSNEDKTEQPTRRRLEKAREEGTVVRAQSLPGAAIMVTAALFLSMDGGALLRAMERAMFAGLRLDPATMRDPALAMARAWRVLAPPVEATAALLLLLFVIGFVSNLAIGGWVFSPKLLMPDTQRISPLAGLKRLFSHEGLAELLKSVAKVVVIGGVTYWVLRDSAASLVDLSRESLPAATVNLADFMTRTLLMLAAALALVAALEVPYQLWSHQGRLRMTRQEVRDEMRDVEVNPHIKQRLRTLRRRMARMRMMTEVPRADVVITNPQHYAAALRYQEGTMRAPRLVAKGSGLIAQRIRELADEHGVPIIEAPPLARAICRYVELEDEIPVGLYRAVAEVLAYLYRLRLARDTGRPAPPPPRDGRFEPPEEFRAAAD
ncbi:MAG: flagellar biosynthesis protein FlhB [Stellaceae bacterium]